MRSLWQTLRTQGQALPAQVAGQNPPWKAKSVWAAFGVMVLGLGLWLTDQARQPETPAGTTPSANQFADSPAGGETKEPAEKKGLKPSSPATFRFGASYLGGFFLGWAFRRFLKATLLISGAVIALLALAKKLGWFEVDWSAVDAHVRHSLAWLQGEAGALKTFLTGYLPSAGLATVGIWFGFRRK